jgi:hypothetical protein
MDTPIAHSDPLVSLGQSLDERHSVEVNGSAQIPSSFRQVREIPGDFHIFTTQIAP